MSKKAKVEPEKAKVPAKVEGEKEEETPADDGPRLTAKQRAFVDEYVVDLNGKQAAIRAGYKSNNAEIQASKLLATPKVSAAVESALLNPDRLSRIKVNHQVDQEYVIGVIKETVDRCRQVRPVLDRRGEQVLVETPNGVITPAFTFDAQGVLRGSELLGKHIGMFREIKEITGKGGGPIQVARAEALTDEELAKIAVNSDK